MKLLRQFILLLLAALWAFAPLQAHAAATLLPNGEQCFSALAATSGGPGGTGTGFVGLLGTITPGSGGTTGTYSTPLTGGLGTGATANITVSGGVVTAVAIVNPGVAYVVGDVLSASSANIGGVTGFSVPVSSVAINQSLAGGKVYFYIPNTTTFKSTWFNADQAAGHQNTNPVKLDANGCAIIYGIGSYRQILQDSLGNTIWDQITTDTSANNNTFWAGLAGGTPNVITLNDPGFNGTAGSVINFKAIANSTGPATANPSSYGAIPIVVNSSIGLTPLVGGEITQTGDFSLLYDSIANAFVLLNPTTSSGGGGDGSIPVGTEISCAGFAAPANFVFEYGQALSRSTNATLFSQLSTGQAGVTISGSPIVTGLTDTSQFSVGMFVEGSGIPAATSILSVDSGSQIHLSANATLSGTAVLTFFAYGNGDGSTTFNVPDRRGRVLVGRDNMGGNPAGVLVASATTNSPDALGSLLSSPASSGGGGITISHANLPAVNLSTGAISVGLSASVNVWFQSGGNTFATGGGNSIANFNAGTIVASVSGVVPLGGSNTPISPINPGVTTNWCLRVQ